MMKSYLFSSVRSLGVLSVPLERMSRRDSAQKAKKIDVHAIEATRQQRERRGKESLNLAQEHWDKHLSDTI